MASPHAIPLSWRNLALVFAGGLALWGIPWLVWPRGGRQAPAAGPQRPPLVVRYVRAGASPDGSAWSPVLMPLPTPDGFSKKAMAREKGGQGPDLSVRRTTLAPLYLDLKLPPPALALPGMTLLATSEFDAGREPPAFSPGSRPGNAGVRVTVSGELQAREFSAPALQELPFGQSGAQAVTVSAQVELDRAGWVTHCLVEEPSGIPGLDAKVDRALRGGRGSAGTGLASGRVRVYYWRPDRSDKEQ